MFPPLLTFTVPKTHNRKAKNKAKDSNTCVFPFTVEENDKTKVSDTYVIFYIAQVGGKTKVSDKGKHWGTFYRPPFSVQFGDNSEFSAHLSSSITLRIVGQGKGRWVVYDHPCTTAVSSIEPSDYNILHAFGKETCRGGLGCRQGADGVNYGTP